MYSKYFLLTVFVLLAFTPSTKADFEDITSSCHSVSADPNSQSSSYRVSGLEGGVYFYMKGSGFSSRGPQDNVVNFGTDLECPIVDFETTTTQVVCEAPALSPDQSVDVSVIVDNKRIATCPSINYRFSATPQIRAIVPSAANAQDEIQFYGIQRVSDVDDIDYFKIGDKRCVMDYGYTGYTFNAHSNVDITCTVGSLAPGYHTVQQRNKGPTGYAMKSDAIPIYLDEDTTYDFVTVPKITEISHSSGSIEGQIITVKGEGLSRTGTQIFIGDDECKILSSCEQSYCSEFTCELPQLLSATLPVQGNHGGLRLETYAGEGSIDNVIAGTSTASVTVGSALTAETAIGADDYYVKKLRGFFKAPTSGDYKFFVAGDDQVRLYLSSTPNSLDDSALTLIASTSSHTGFRNYGAYDTQISDLVPLEEDDEYLLEIYHKESWGGDHASVGVQIPGITQDVNPVKEVQKIQLECPTIQQVVDFTVVSGTSGTWKIRIQIYDNNNVPLRENPYETSAIAFDASDEDVESALAGIGYTVHVTKSEANGITTWSTSFETRLSIPNEIGKIGLVCDVNTEGSNLCAFTTVTAPSDVLGGTFTLEANLQTVELGFDAAASEVSEAIRGLGFEPSITVSRIGDPYSGAAWLVEFGASNGNVDQITSPSHLLTGCDETDPGNTVGVTVTTEQDYDNTQLYYEVIPFHLLSTADETPQIRVTVNGLKANCPENNCGYEIIESIPNIDSASYTGTTLDLSISSTTATEEDLVVTFGNQPCTISSWIAPDLEADCPAPEGGDHFPRVHVDGLGYASISAVAITVPLTITNVSPSTINANGGTEITITGTGFPSSAEEAEDREMEVLIGTAECIVSSVSSTSIVCVNSENAGGLTLTINLNGATQTDGSISLLGSVPTISAVTPDVVSPVLTTAIQIDGSNFGTDIGSTTVTLINQADSSLTYSLTVTNVADTQIDCTYLGARTADYWIMVTNANGNSNKFTFVSKVEITSVSPTSGSILGGTELTITGGTFSTDTQQNLVYLIASTDDDILCDVTAATTTEVTCVTRAQTAEMTGTLDVVVATRIVEESVCGGTCNFEYTTADTPEVTALSASSFKAGDVITVTGTGFDTINDIEVLVGDNEMTPTLDSATEFTFAVPDDAVPGADQTLSIRFVKKGYASFNGVSELVEIALSLDSIAPTSGPISSGILLTLTGAHFQSGQTVTVGGQDCAIITQSSTEITCKAISAGEVLVVDEDAGSAGCDTPCSVSDDATNQPTVTNNDNQTPGSSTFQIIVTGTNLNLDTAAVKLHNQGDEDVSFVGVVSNPTATTLDVDFTDVVAGDYVLEVVIGTKYAAITTGMETVEVAVTGTLGATIDTSIAGGRVAQVTGSGFYTGDDIQKNYVEVCGLPAVIDDATTATELYIIAPVFKHADVKATYTNFLKAEKVVSGTWFGDADEDQITSAHDDAFTTYYASSADDCYIGLDVGDSKTLEITMARFFPRTNYDASKFEDSQIQGSDDGVTWTTLGTIDGNSHAGWNSWYPSGTESYRYYRFFGNSADGKCGLAELEFYGYLMSDKTITDLTSVQCDAVIEVAGKTLSISAMFDYQSGLTPHVTAIDGDDYGSSAGGETVTLVGTQFEASIGATTVTIDDVDCSVSAASATEVECTTGAAPAIDLRRNSLRSEITVFFDSYGYAIVDTTVTYFYVDAWSEDSTWQGLTLPIEGDSVSIPSGQTILLDISPPKLYAIIIEGALIFKDDNINLDCHYIIIRNGRLQIGTEERPIQNKITVTLHGTKEDPHLPQYGNKVIALREGILDIHGQTKSETWVMLETTASAGDDTITLDTLVTDWAVGDIIVIASTDHDHYQSEEREITAVDNGGSTTVLTLNETLVYEHYAGEQTFGGETISMRAEVGLLTRNVVIQGDPSSQENLYGVHIMTFSPYGNDSSISRISYTEVRFAGQAFNLGRYPIHYHMIGDVVNSYVLGNSIHHTFNRAVTIHGVHYLKVQKNVAYWTMGHTIFIEDGIETNNLIEDNLVMNVKSSESLLNTDQTPACFWITNPNNIWRRNHCAGSDRYGFWFDLRAHPEGPSATDSICPVGERLGIFTDNEAHSVGRYALRVFHEHIPRTYPCRAIKDDSLEDPYSENPPIPAVYENFKGWKNRRDTVIGERLGAVEFRNIQSADNHRAGIEISDGNYGPKGSLLVEDALIVGVSPAESANEDVYSGKSIRGIISPKVDNFYVKNIRFHNFNTASMTAIETCSHCEHPAATDSGGRTAYYEDLSFTNVVQRVRYNVPLRGILVDVDGTLSGGAMNYLTYYYKHLDMPGCTEEDEFDGLVCEAPVRLSRILVHEADSELNGMDLRVLRMTDGIDLNATTPDDYSTITFRGKANPKNHWVFIVALGEAYKYHFANGIDYEKLTLTRGDVWEAASKESVTLIANYTDYREAFEIKVDGSKIENQTTLWDPYTASSVDAHSYGDWYHDIDNKHLYMTFNDDLEGGLNIKAFRCNVSCPQPAGVPEWDGVERRWSDEDIWEDSIKPVDGDNVTIPNNWKLLLDESTPALEFLDIQGELVFTAPDEDAENSHIKISAQRIWVQGILSAGNSTHPYEGNAEIELTGGRDSESLLLGNFNDVSNKVLAVTGNFSMHGQKTQTPWSRLTQSIAVGDTELTLTNSVETDGWAAGDMIMIAPSERNSRQFETREIATVVGNIITLTEGVEFAHYGNESFMATSQGVLDMRTEVALLSRNIKIHGTDVDGWGGRIYTTQIYDTESESFFRGKTVLDNVELYYMGQANTTQAGLTFEILTTDNALTSHIVRSVIRDSPGMNVLINRASEVTIEDSVIFNAYKSNVYIMDANTRINILNNLIVATINRDLNAEQMVDMTVALYQDAQASLTESNVNNNIIAGCDDICVLSKTGNCVNGPFQNNVAHSAAYGWLGLNPDGGYCNQLNSFTAYKVESGVVSYFPSSSIVTTNLVITDSQRAVVLLTGSMSSNTQNITVSDSHIAGVADINNLDAYESGNDGENVCSGNVGIYIGASTTGAKKVPPSPSALPWRKIKTDALWLGTMTVSNTEFKNYHDDVCSNMRIFTSNEFASDNSNGLFFENIIKTNVGSNNLFFFKDASPGDVGIDNCGGDFCTGLRNIITKVRDTSLTGQASSTMLPNNREVINEDTCTLNLEMNGYICEGLGWGLLTFQSLDIDQRTRLISPITVQREDGFSNELNSYMDHGWDGFYTSLKRLSRFHSIVETGRTDYEILYTGTLPNDMRFQLHHAESDHSIAFKQRYTTPQTVRVSNNGIDIRPKLAASDLDIADSDTCGTHIYTGGDQTVQVKLTGDPSCDVTVKLTNTVKGWARYSLSVDEFFEQDGPTTFVDNVANVLKIDVTRVRITSVERGSTIIGLSVEASNQGTPETQEDYDEIYAELEDLKERLIAAIEDGSISVPGAELLDYSFAINVKTITTESTLEKVSKTLIVIAAFVALGSLVIGIFLTVNKYSLTLRKVKASKAHQNQMKKDGGADFIEFSGSCSDYPSENVNPDGAFTSERINGNNNNDGPGISVDVRDRGDENESRHENRDDEEDGGSGEIVLEHNQAQSGSGGSHPELEIQTTKKDSAETEKTPKVANNA